MADAETFHATIVERIARTNAYAAAVAANVETLTAIDGVTDRTRDGDQRGTVHVRTPGNGDVWGEAEVMNDSVTVKLHGLAPETALRLLALAMGQAVR